MKCEHPLSTTGTLLPCGKCVPCTVNKKKLWTHRLELEASKWSDNTFLTLTYDDAHLPADGSVDVKTLQDFIKRLRRYHEPLQLRYFACGEYGDISWRPHYHVLVFNFATCDRLQSHYGRSGLTCCQRCKDVSRIWGFGNVYLARVEPQSIQYVCGYVVKKMTHRQDVRLSGRFPEFARMSLKPGIGASAMDDVKSATNGMMKLQELSSISYNKMERPIGRYLKKKLLQLEDGGTKILLSRLRKYDRVSPYSEEMCDLHESARVAKTGPVVQYQEKYKGKLASQKAKLKLRGLKNETL